MKFIFVIILLLGELCRASTAIEELYAIERHTTYVADLFLGTEGVTIWIKKPWRETVWATTASLFASSANPAAKSLIYTALSDQTNSLPTDHPFENAASLVSYVKEINISGYPLKNGVHRNVQTLPELDEICKYLANNTAIIKQKPIPQLFLDEQHIKVYQLDNGKI